MTAYALTMPACPTSKGRNDENDMLEALGLRAFKLFKQRKMAMFFIFSMLLGVSLQITNGYANPYITSFKDIPEFASAGRHATPMLSSHSLRYPRRCAFCSFHSSSRDLASRESCSCL